ncbi:hypothetical protein C8Q75DRAFT_38853 [Abortiporus biennis]|nr:hypothetical protein C8Q75DRAFT_38853 [Abortiporus biennis]
MENNTPKPDVYVEIRMDGILFEHFLFSKEQHQTSCYGWQDEENVIHRYLWVRSSALRCRTLEKLNKTTRSEQQGTIRVTLYEFDRQRLRISSDWICSRHEHVKRPSPSRLYPPSGREKPSHYAHIGAKKSNRAGYKVQRSHSILNRCSILGVLPMLTVIFDYSKSVRRPSVVSRPRQTEVPMTTTHNHSTRRNNMLNNPQTSSQQPAQMPVGNRVTEGGGMQPRSDNARQPAQMVKEEPADDSNLLGHNARQIL